MKIGAFARHNQVSIDTVRHYISLELLLPKKVNSQYEFDLQCQEDFSQVVFFKELGFTLAEIKNIFILKQLGKMTSLQQEKYYTDIFKEKLEVTAAEIARQTLEKSRLQRELRKLNSKSESHPFPMGIRLDWLKYLRCDKCGKPFVLKEASVAEDQILSGTLRCACGNEYTVRDGILFTDSVHQEDEPWPSVQTYLQHTDPEYLRHIYKTLEWCAQNADFTDFSGKVLVEPGCGAGYFLRRIYDSLPDDCIYIAVDYNPDALRPLKEILEKAERRKNVFFICCDFLHLPLAAGLADIVCDFSGTSNFCFDHKEFLLKRMEPFLKPDTALIGSYVIFKNFNPDSLVSVDCRNNFRIEQVKRQLAELGFSPDSEYRSDVVEKGGIYENYFKAGEKVLTYCLCGKRSG